MKKKIILVPMIISILLVIFFVWPTLYKYEHLHQGRSLIRIHRITGDAEILDRFEGWKKMEKKEIHFEGIKLNDPNTTALPNGFVLDKKN